MKFPLSILVILLAAPSCRKENGRPASAADTAGKKTATRMAEGTSQMRTSAVDAILSIPNRAEIRTREQAERLQKGIKSLSDQDLHLLLEKISKIRNTPEEKLTFAWAISELARRDPETVMSWYPPGEIRGDEAGYTAVLAVLAESRPDILKKWLSEDLKTADSAVQGQWLSMGVACLSQFDAAAAFEFSKTLAGRLDTKELILVVFAEFAKQSPAKALAAAEASFTGSDLNYARYNIALGTKDPDVCIEIARGIPDIRDRGNMIAGTLSRWMDSDRPAALKKLKELAAKDLQAALQAGAGDSHSLLDKLGKSEPDMLIGLLDTVVASRATENLFRSAVESLVANNPDTAKALIESMPDGEMKTKMLGARFHALAEQDSAGALLLASQLGNADGRNQAYQNIGFVIGPRGLEEILKVSEALPPADESSFLESALTYVNAHDPKDAAGVLASGKAELAEPAKQELLERVAWNLNGVDAPYAKDWLTKLPAEDQPYAMKGIASQMALSDITGLSTMLDSLPRNRNWEAGVRVMIENIKGADPGAAAQWQEQLTEAGYP